MEVMTGMHDDSIMMNGTIAPLFVPTTNKVRFRLLNAANARTFNFAFDDNREFQLIGSDGGFLNAAITLRNLELAPAERAEIVVDFIDGAPVNLISRPIPADFLLAPQAMMPKMLPLGSSSIQLLAIEPQPRLEQRVHIPPRTGQYPPHKRVRSNAHTPLYAFYADEYGHDEHVRRSKPRRGHDKRDGAAIS